MLYSIALEIPHDATYEKNVMCLSLLTASLTNICYKIIAYYEMICILTSFKELIVKMILSIIHHGNKVYNLFLK